MDPKDLRVFELDYELHRRDFSTKYSDVNLDLKRSILKRKMLDNSDIIKVTYTESSSVEIEESLHSIEGVINSYPGKNPKAMSKRINSRLMHIKGRIEDIDHNDDEDLILKQKEWIDRYYVLYSKFDKRVQDYELNLEALNRQREVSKLMQISAADNEENPSTSNAAISFNIAEPKNKTKGQESLNSTVGDTSFVQQISSLRLDNVSKNEMSHSTSPKSIPVYKWGLQFNGESNLLNSFLERIEELRIARHLSEGELFVSAVDLFNGPALVWYRSVRHLHNNWNSLVQALREDFLMPDYDENLESEIKARIQGRNERVGIYIAVMENLYNRLSIKPSEEVRLKQIRKNLLPSYSQQLALHDITSISELTELCRKLEKARLTQPQVRKQVAVLEPELRGEGFPQHFDSSGPQKQSVRSQISQNRSRVDVNYIEAIPSTSKTNPPLRLPNKSVLICWNCDKSGHAFKECKLKRGRFCYRCGNKNQISTNCNRCVSKN